MKEGYKNIFYWLNEITFNKTHPSKFSNEDFINFDSFMINRFISMNVNYVEVANFLQTFPPSDKRQIYTAYRELIPKNKLWLKYIKNQNKHNFKEAIKFISLYFSCSLKEAKNYMEILPKDEIELIFSKMGLDKKEIKKII